MRARLPAALLLLPVAAWAACGQAQPAVPAAPASDTASGLIALGDGAVAFVPAGMAAAGPAPLLVLLHGSGGAPAGMIGRFRRHAERRGVILLAPAPFGSTWDMVERVTGRGAGGSRRSTGPSVDPPRIEAALAALAQRVAIDRSRIGVAGFSDGASYALTLGALNPDLFGTILAFSPGMAFLPREMRPGQRVFLAHGRGDRRLPFSVSARLEPRLRARGLAVTFRRFEGDHVLPDPIAGEGVGFFVGAGPAD